MARIYEHRLRVRIVRHVQKRRAGGHVRVNDENGERLITIADRVMGAGWEKRKSFIANVLPQVLFQKRLPQRFENVRVVGVRHFRLEPVFQVGFLVETLSYYPAHRIETTVSRYIRSTSYQIRAIEKIVTEMIFIVVNC